MGCGECSMLAMEAAGGFTGVIIAMYATGSGAWSTSPAHFDWFAYRGSNNYLRGGRFSRFNGERPLILGSITQRSGILEYYKIVRWM
ncbi:hypothetical protein [Paenibacillus mucilaginosus]|uniref:beta-xylosidase family glycoside hydrolase n=1 Tax=Paenibacillus mucilaginosus TaxID=61624 RepID=UPI003D22BEE9